MTHGLGLFKKSALFSGVLLLITACSTGEKQSPQIQREPPGQVGSAQERKEVQEAVNLYRAKKHKQALAKFNTYIAKHPDTDLAQEAHYYVGQIHFDGGDSQKALKAWTAITSTRTESPFYDRALYGNAVIYNQSGKQTEALSELNKFNYRNPDKALSGNAAELSSRLKLAKGDGVGALTDLQKVAELKPSEAGRIQTRSREIVQTQLGTKQLEEVVGRSDLVAYEPAARFKLAMGYYDQRNWSESRSRFNDLIAKFPNSEEAQRAQQYLTSTTETTSADGTVIGAVLPLTGKYAQMGYKTLRGIQLGLGTFNR
jgi:TolA-binding protein